MQWYLIEKEPNSASELLKFLNDQDNILAFIPKLEKWHNVKEVKDYVVKDLYPNHLCVQTSLNEQEFKDVYMQFSHHPDHVYRLSQEEQSILEKLFNNEQIIYHSTGSIIHSRFKASKGSLKGLEDHIIKINRHHRFATLDIKIMNIPLLIAIELIDPS